MDSHVYKKEYMSDKISIIAKNYRQMLVFSIFIFALVQFVYAQAQQQSYVTLRTVPWELTVFVAILIQLLIVGLAYMFSSLFGIKELNAWSKNEVYQVIMMAFVVFLFFGIIKIENIVFEAYGFDFTLDYQNPAIKNSQAYLSSVRQYSLSIVTSTQTTIYLLSLGSYGLQKTDIFSAASNSLIRFINLGNILDSIIGDIVSLLTIINFSATSVLGLTTLQIYFLDVVDRVAFTLLLPFGLFLRMFSFTRSSGNFLIVLAIAFYIVFPLTFLMNQTIVDTLLSKERGWEDILSVRQDLNSGFKDFLLFSEKLKNDDIFFSEFISSFFAGFKFIDKYFNPFNILDEAAFAFLLFTIIPILDFTITIVVAKELGNLFGSEITFVDIMKQL